MNKHKAVDDLNMEAHRLNCAFDSRALVKAGEALQLAIESHYQRGHATSLLRLAVAHANSADYPKALELLENALFVYESAEITQGKSAIFYEKARILTKTGKISEALDYHFQALSLNETEGITHSHASSLNSIGVSYKTLGDFPQALRFLLRAFSMHESLHDSLACAGVLNNIGGIYTNLGEYHNALEYYMRSLQFHVSEENPLLRAFTLNGIGSCYAHLGEYSNALKYLHESLALKEAIGNADSIANTLMNIGYVHQSQSEYATALAFFERSLTLLEKTGNTAGMCKILLNIGENYVNRTLYNEARTKFLESLELAKFLGNLAMIAELSLPLGNIEQISGNNSGAIEYYEQGLLIAREIGNKELMIALTESLYTAWKSNGHYPHKALHYFRAFQQLDRERNHHQARAGINAILVKFETSAERKKAELTELKNRNLHAELEAKLVSLETLAKELVKNQEILATLRENVSNAIATSAAPTKQKLQRILHVIAETNEKYSGLQTLNETFKHRFPDFSHALRTRFPRLSPVEITVSCLLKIRLNTKEIAALLFLSERTIDSHRASIRKKIGIKAKEDLSDFLNSM